MQSRRRAAQVAASAPVAESNPIVPTSRKRKAESAPKAPAKVSAISDIATEALSSSADSSPTVITISQEQMRWFRLKRNGLVDPIVDALKAASVNVGVQAQVLSAGYTALWNRSMKEDKSLYTQAELDQFTHGSRELVKLWSQRHTLHLFPSSDWPLVHAANSWKSGVWEKNVEQKGSDVDKYRKAIREVTALVEKKKFLTRSDLKHLKLQEELLSGWGGVFAELVNRGIACHAGSNDSGETQFAARSHWLPDLKWDAPHVDDANLELFRRYFACYGPASAKDVAYWAGARSEDCKRVMAKLLPELAEIRVTKTAADDADDKPQKRKGAAVPMYVLKSDLKEISQPAPVASKWPLKLLGPYDPLLLAHQDKSWIIDPAHKHYVWKPAGRLDPCMLYHGRIVGSWSYKKLAREDRIVVTLEPFDVMSVKLQHAFSDIANEFAVYLGVSGCEVNYCPKGSKQTEEESGEDETEDA